MAARERDQRGSDQAAERTSGRAGAPHKRSSTLADRVRGRVTSELNAQKNRVTQQLDDVAETVRRMGDPLREPPYAPLAEYVHNAAGRIERMASDLRERNVEELAHELGDLARRQPAVFVGATLAAGIVAARFLKSSSADVTPRRRVRVPRSDEARKPEV